MNKTQQKKKQKKIKASLRQSLKQGTMLYMDGQLAPPSQISARMMREDGGYMADYVTDEEGHIMEIRYDKIKM